MVCAAKGSNTRALKRGPVLLSVFPSGISNGASILCPTCWVSPVYGSLGLRGYSLATKPWQVSVRSWVPGSGLNACTSSSGGGRGGRGCGCRRCAPRTAASLPGLSREKEPRHRLLHKKNGRTRPRKTRRGETTGKHGVIATTASYSVLSGSMEDPQ